MARYTQLKMNDIQAIAGRYDLAVGGFAPIEGGAGNSSFKLQTGQGDYVLTVFDDKSRGDVAGLGKLLLRLAEGKFPTTRLRLSAEGEALTMYQSKPVLLKPFIIGQVCKDWTMAMLQQVGAALAELHQVSAPTFLAHQHPYGLQAFSTVFGRNINPPYEAWLAEKHTYLTQRIPADLPRALIHGDLFFDNVLFADSVFCAIIDFEEACYYFRIFDLGMAILGLCTNAATIELDKARALVDGYQQVQKLEERETAALQLFVEYAAIATSYWRFWKYNVHMVLPEKANSHFQMVHLANAVRTMPKSTFLKALFLQA